MISNKLLGPGNSIPAGQVLAPFSGLNYVDDVFSINSWIGNGSTMTVPSGINIMGSQVSALNLTAQGNNYTSAPAVSFSGGGSSTPATATANLVYSSGGVTQYSWNTTFPSSPTFFAIGGAAPYNLTYGGGIIMNPAVSMIYWPDTRVVSMFSGTASGVSNGTYTWYANIPGGYNYFISPSGTVTVNAGSIVGFSIVEPGCIQGSPGNLTASFGSSGTLTLSTSTTSSSSSRICQMSATGGQASSSGAYVSGYVGNASNGPHTAYSTSTTTSTTYYKVGSVTLTNPGAGYATTPSVSISGGGGSGATATATLSAPNPGLIWVKNRTSGTAHVLSDTMRGPGRYSDSSSSALDNSSTQTITAFNSTNYTLGNSSLVNASTNTYSGYAFKQCSNFFEMIQFTGNGNGSNQTQVLNHTLGKTPGMIIFNKVSGAGSNNWEVWHRNSPTPSSALNSSSGGGYSVSSVSSVSSTTITLISASGSYSNNAGSTYIAYVFAHDTSINGIIQCGSYVDDGSTQSTAVDLGWEPQFVLVKALKSGGGGSYSWNITDDTRGTAPRSLGAAESKMISPNSATSEQSAYPGGIYYNSRGFTACYDTVGRSKGAGAGYTYIYLAIRRPTKVLSGNDIFSAVTYTGNGTITGPSITALKKIDAAFVKSRSSTAQTVQLSKSTVPKACADLNAENTSTTIINDFVPGSIAWSTGSLSNVNASGVNYVLHAFRRSPGVFDTLTYFGDNSASRVIPHSLYNSPRIVISSAVSNKTNLMTKYVQGVVVNASAPNAFLSLNTNLFLMDTDDSPRLSNFTSESYTISSGGLDLNTAGDLYHTMLFGDMPGISKSGVYSGNGTAQTIDCGFTTGARYILLKSIAGATTTANSMTLSIPLGGSVRVVTEGTVTTDTVYTTSQTLSIAAGTTVLTIYGQGAPGATTSTDSELVLDSVLNNPNPNTNFMSVYYGIVDGFSQPPSANIMLSQSNSMGPGQVNTDNINTEQHISFVYYTGGPVYSTGDSATVTFGGSTYEFEGGTGGAAVEKMYQIDIFDSSWWAMDTARGIVASVDPIVSYNGNASEIITDDAVDPTSSGFIINETSTTHMNTVGNMYLYLALA